MNFTGVAKAIGNVSTVAFITYLGWELFRRKLWRSKLFAAWLVDVPDIVGTWKGKITPSWVDPSTGEPTAPIDVTLVVRQRFNSVNIQFRTDNGSSQSDSVVANFVTNDESERCRLVYTYANEAKRTNATLDDHCGTVVLDIEDEPPSRMRGFYMNDRNQQSKGEIEVLRA